MFLWRPTKDARISLLFTSRYHFMHSGAPFAVSANHKRMTDHAVWMFASLVRVLKLDKILLVDESMKTSNVCLPF